MITNSFRCDGCEVFVSSVFVLSVGVFATILWSSFSTTILHPTFFSFRCDRIEANAAYSVTLLSMLSSLFLPKKSHATTNSPAMGRNEYLQNKQKNEQSKNVTVPLFVQVRIILMNGGSSFVWSMHLNSQLNSVPN